MMPSVVILGPLAACHPPPAGDSAPTEAAAPAGPAAGEATAPDPWRGRDLSDLLVPLLAGGELPLRTLAGGAVLRVVAPGARASDGALAWARQVAATPGAPTVVLVSLDPEALDVGARWGPIPPPGVRLGWDPQGAFAARLGVSRLPLVLLLDGAVVREAWEGEAPAPASLAAAPVPPGASPAEG